MAAAGRVSVVTGAASGLGQAIARRFAADGGSVVVADIQEERGASVAEEVGGLFVRTDVSREGDVAAAVAAAVERYGRLDVMVNNAGILGAVGPVAEIRAEAWAHTIDVMLSGVFYGIKHAARQMIAQGDGGAIVNTASSAGVRPGLGPHVYTAAKHGVVGLSGSVAVELGGYGIRVNCVAPGGTTTPLTAQLVVGDHTALDAARSIIGKDTPLGRGGLPEDIADAVAFLASEQASWVSGTVLVVDGSGDVNANANGTFVALGPELYREAGRRGL